MWTVRGADVPQNVSFNWLHLQRTHGVGLCESQARRWAFALGGLLLLLLLLLLFLQFLEPAQRCETSIYRQLLSEDAGEGNPQNQTAITCNMQYAACHQVISCILVVNFKGNRHFMIHIWVEGPCTHLACRADRRGAYALNAALVPGVASLIDYNGGVVL